MLTNSSPVMIGAVCRCMAAIYRPGFRYQKCGVTLIDLLPSSINQQDLFVEDTCEQQDNLMTLVDGINRQMGRGSLFFDAQGTQQRWGLRCQKRSPRYTTRWVELMVARC